MGIETKAAEEKRVKGVVIKNGVQRKKDEGKQEECAVKQT